MYVISMLCVMYYEAVIVHVYAIITMTIVYTGSYKALYVQKCSWSYFKKPVTLKEIYISSYCVLHKHQPNAGKSLRRNNTRVSNAYFINFSIILYLDVRETPKV